MAFPDLSGQHSAAMRQRIVIEAPLPVPCRRAMITGCCRVNSVVRWTVFSVLTLLGLAANASEAQSNTLSNALQEAPCRLEAKWLPAVLAECGHLVVPEDRARPDGPTLSLFVARIPALTATPRPDPVVLLAGGPGQSAVDLYLQLRAAFEPLRRDRDLILLDQRGTGRSAEGFRCEFPDDLDLDAGSPSAIKTAMKACLDQLKHDPRFFSTSPAVKDLDALRAALGVEQWNLYGVSYGTRVAQQYARRYPERIRTLILDGVVPAELVLGPNIALNAQHALYSIFSRCAADLPCGKRFPELGLHFDTLMRRLERAPVTIKAPDPLTGQMETRRFTATELAGAVRLMSYSAPTVALLPLAINEAYSGHYEMLSAEAEMLRGSTADALNIPMHNSVVCTEDVPFFPDQSPANTEQTYLGSTIIDSVRAICSVWPRGVMDPDFKQPLEFTGPVLLLSGSNDPITPPEYAIAAVAHGLRNSVHLVGHGQGHGMAAVGCVPRLIASFVGTANPSSVQGKCLASVPPTPYFLSPSGPGP